MSKEKVTIKEDFRLPSEGMIYGKPFDPKVTLRSMTVMDEMKRLSPSKYPYKNMSEIIESCMEEKLPISVYDLCIGDYTYLLHKLRVVTYGNDYPIKFICPICNNVETINVDLDKMKINRYKESIKDFMKVKLPASGNELTIRYQTPRDLDRISNEAREMKEEFPDMVGDPTQLLTLQSMISESDGQPIDRTLIKETLKKLPMKDANAIAKAATKLNTSIGIDTNLKVHCNSCGADIDTPFRYTNEFFGPTD